MRRAERNLKEYATGGTAKGRADFVKANVAENAEQKVFQLGSKPTEQPGRGELVGGKEFQRADEFAKLARQKGGTDEIQRRLGMMLATARHEGRKGAEDNMLGIVRQNQEKHTDDVVCGFVAMAGNSISKAGVPALFTIAGHTIVCVLDALNRAGYTAHGKN